ncbi:22275_t:CDS:1, partial [Entrophospora sp. SA101]
SYYYLSLQIPNEDLALIQWYDFKYTNDPKRFYNFECPYLKLI